MSDGNPMIPYGGALTLEQRLARVEQRLLEKPPAGTPNGCNATSDTSQPGGVKWEQRAGSFAGILIGGTTTSWTGGVAGSWGAFIPGPGSHGFTVAREKHAGSTIVGSSSGWGFLTIPATGLWQITVRVYAEGLGGTTERVGFGLMGSASASSKVYATRIYRCIGNPGDAVEETTTFNIYATAGDVVFPSFLRVGTTTTFNTIIAGGAASFGCSLSWVYLG